MSEEKDFFKTCFNTVASLDVKNESQAIAKEVVLSEVEKLQQENQLLKERIDKAIEFYENNKKECVIGRTREEKLRKDYYLPAHLSKTLIDIIKEVSE